MKVVEPVRVAVIGIGFGQHVHVPAFRADGRAKVEAICASSLERAQAIAERLAIPRPFGDWRRVCVDPNVDAIAISVPAALQPEIIALAARHGKHVFCEKPLATTEAAAQAAFDDARAAGIVHAIDFEFRAIPHWQRAREICVAGTLGRLRQAAITWRVETLAYRERRETWKTDAAAGGGTLALFGSHVLDYVEWLFGPIARVAARLEPHDDAAGDARVDAWLQLASGLPVVVSLAADAFCGAGHRVEVYGDDGTLVLDNPTKDYVQGFRLALATREKGCLEEIMAPATGAADGRVLAVGYVVARFLDQVLGTPGTAAADLPTLADGLRAQAWADQLRRASRLGTWQS
jgi:predicted dehydrogenase